MSIGILLTITARNRQTDLDETMGLWDGADAQEFTVDGVNRTYYGAGALLDLPSIIEEEGLGVRVHTISLSHLTPEVKNLVDLYDVRFAPVYLHRALFDPQTGALVDAPELELIGRVDDTGWQRDGDKLDFEIMVAGRAQSLTRTLPVKKSDASQRRRGGDRFRRYAAYNTTVKWGRK